MMMRLVRLHRLQGTSRVGSIAFAMAGPTSPRSKDTNSFISRSIISVLDMTMLKDHDVLCLGNSWDKGTERKVKFNGGILSTTECCCLEGLLCNGRMLRMVTSTADGVLR